MAIPRLAPDLQSPPQNKIGQGACEWLAKLLRGGHLHAVTQWPTEGEALESALELVVSGAGIVFPDEGYKWLSHGLFVNTGFGLGEACTQGCAFTAR